MNRLTDFFLSLIFFLMLLPLMLVISILIKFDSRGPVFFISTRVGQNNQKFKMIKFRTMYINTELIESAKLKDPSSKVTKLGKIMRKLSIDEIPQFFNVLNNDMSIVGPRPLPEINEKKINKNLRIKRRKVPPGITGMSQGNYTGKYRKLEDKVKLDVSFIDNYSLFIYFKILLRTPIVLIIRLLKNKSSIIK